MSSRDPLTTIVRADNRWDTVGGAIGGVLIGFVLAFGTGIINYFQAAASVLVKPLESLGINLGALVGSYVGGAADIIDQGAVTTQQALLPGQTWAIGPLTFVISILSVAAGLFALAWILSVSPTSDLIPFSFTDFPGLGVDEDEEEITEED